MRGDGLSERLISLSGACSGLFPRAPGPRARRKEAAPANHTSCSVHFPLADLLLFVVSFLPYRAALRRAQQRLRRVSSLVLLEDPKNAKPATQQLMKANQQLSASLLQQSRRPTFVNLISH